MRISDWKSDVCSSDLRDLLEGDGFRRSKRGSEEVGRESCNDQYDNAGNCPDDFQRQLHGIDPPARASRDNNRAEAAPEYVFFPFIDRLRSGLQDRKSTRLKSSH